MQHIVLVEDDDQLRELVSDFLRQHDFSVTELASGERLPQTMNSSVVDLVILDVNLPGKDGFELCRRLRHTYKGPILFLTARDDNIDQIIGFELGADDYVTKPAEPRILLARIRALLRRQEQPADKPNQPLMFDGLIINLATRGVTLHGSPVILTSHEYDILEYLAKHKGEIVSRDQLYTEVLGREYDGLDRSVDVRVSRLRGKLGDDPKDPKRIKTIWGKGFYFVEGMWNRELDA